MALCSTSHVVRREMKSRATRLYLRTSSRANFERKWRMVRCLVIKEVQEKAIRLPVLGSKRSCFQVREPSQWSQVTLYPLGMAFSMVKGCEPWAAAIRSCAGTCLASRGHCSHISCIPFTWSPSPLVIMDFGKNSLETLMFWDKSHVNTAFFYRLISFYSSSRLSVQPRSFDPCCLLSPCQRWWSLCTESAPSLHAEPSRGNGTANGHLQAWW